MSKLSALEVKNAKPKEKPYKIPDGLGMFLYVAKTGKKTWRYRYKIAGIESTFTLGDYPEMSLEKARQARMEARALVKQGINPSHKRKEEYLQAIKERKEEILANQNSFEAITIEWIDQQKDGWSRDHCNAVLATLRADAFPSLGSLAVDKITPPDVLKIIREIESRGALEIARKVLQRMNAVFRYAIQTGRLIHNPAADMQGVIKTRKVEHRAALTKNELPEFFRRLQQSDEHIITKAALLFTIHTATRSGEVRLARWNEIDLDEMVWKIPAERMKMRSPHIVPLTSQTKEILKAMESHKVSEDGLVFPGIKNRNKPLSENTMLYALYRMGYHSKATVHGFRATFSTIANESGLFSGDVIEKVLAHEQRNKVRAAYHRSEYIEQRRELLLWWSSLLDEMRSKHA